jgi:hypothetical protein
VFRALLGEAIHDAIRRRIVPAIAFVSLLSLMMVDGCTSCTAPTIVQNGVSVEVPEVAGWTGLVIFTVLALWTMVLAGILASDHLAEVLSDGTAPLVLSRPVSRASFALARLWGVLAIALVTGAVLLGGSTALLVLRNGVPVGPAILGGLACALGATVTASLAMAASLYLPRIATVMVVLVGIGAIATVNAVGMSGVELSGAVWAIDRFGPPLATSVAAAISAWVAPVELSFDVFDVSIRSAAWAIAAIALLVVSFRNQDIGK